MAVSALVQIGDKFEADGLLAAYVGSERRGVGDSLEIPIGPHTGKNVFTVMVYGTAKEMVTFKYSADGSAGKAIDLGTEVTFAEDAGSLIEPLILTPKNAVNVL